MYGSKAAGDQKHYPLYLGFRWKTEDSVALLLIIFHTHKWATTVKSDSVCVFFLFRFFPLLSCYLCTCADLNIEKLAPYVAECYCIRATEWDAFNFVHSTHWNAKWVRSMSITKFDVFQEKNSQLSKWSSATSFQPKMKYRIGTVFEFDLVKINKISTK